MNRKFKAPPASDLKQWAKVRFLADHGFRFGSIVDAKGFRVPYPGTLQEAHIFVREYAGELSAGWLTEDGPPKGKRVPRQNATEPTITASKQPTSAPAKTPRKR